MRWVDDGVVLGVRPHGETSAVLALLTREHGRHAGLVHGATSRRLRGVLQSGNRVSAVWSARQAESLGSFGVELRRGHAADLFDDPFKLSGLIAVAAVAERVLPEREPHPAVYEGMLAFIDTLERPELGDAWIAAYIRWELGLLAELGFALDLSRCAVTGATNSLTYVSPRSGRAVSAEIGAPYHAKLLPLPDFLAGRGGGNAADLEAGLALTGHFLSRHVFGAHGVRPPAARDRFVERVRRMA